MHELAICQALLDQVTRLAASHHAQQVSRIVVRIGPLSGVDPHALNLAFPLAAAGSVAQEAELVIDAVPVVIRCPDCDLEHTATSQSLLCPSCGQPGTLVSGDELLLQQIALELP